MTGHDAPASGSPAAAALTIRPAVCADIDAIENLIGEASRTTTVLPRPRLAIIEQLRDFVVAESGGRLVGCAALNLQAEGLAEIKSLVVAPGLRAGGVGRRLVAALVEQGRGLGLDRLFALTDSVGFFEKAGFALADKETLPHKVWNECIRCPKFFNCAEEAVEMLLEPSGGSPPQSDPDKGNC